MDRKTFADRFREAAATCRDFCKTFVQEQLPSGLQFRLRLNSSYDENPLDKDETVYPEDSRAEVRHALRLCTTDQVIEALWRDGRVPEWVNLSPCGLMAEATVIEVLACGRFTDNERLLYHQVEGRPPFHVLGPPLPVDWVRGQKFSLYQRVNCASRAEIDAMVSHAAKVQWLELEGDEFDDAAVVRLPKMPNLCCLTLTDSAVQGTGLACLDRHPNLGVLRIGLSRPVLELKNAPKLKRLTSLDISNLPPHAWGFRDWLPKLPSLKSMTLTGSGMLVLDGELPDLESLSLSATRLAGNLKLPERIDSLTLHLSEETADGLVEWVRNVRQVRHLSLDGTPVNDAVFDRLVSRWRLESARVSNTLVTDALLRELALTKPKLRVFPRVVLGQLKPEQVRVMTEAELSRPMRFKNFHGLTPDKLHSSLIEPYTVMIAPDDDEAPRQMWALLPELPGGYLLALDPNNRGWVVADRDSGAAWRQLVWSSTLDGALDSEDFATRTGPSNPPSEQ